jgi:hypothetical protein
LNIAIDACVSAQDSGGCGHAHVRGGCDFSQPYFTFLEDAFVMRLEPNLGAIIDQVSQLWIRPKSETGVAGFSKMVINDLQAKITMRKFSRATRKNSGAVVS